MALVTLNYWAGARAAAGIASETVPAGSVQEALDAVDRAHGDPRFSRVVRASSLLVDGVTAHRDDLLRPRTGAVEVEVLPPFAGG